MALVLALASCHPAAQPTPHPKPTQTLGVLTALPLFWGEGAFGAAATGEDQRAPLIQKLSSVYQVNAVDVLTPSILADLDILMLVQPRRLAPAELVDLEAWVNGGGHLILFADPLLDWPSDFPLGDPRRAPPVTLLDPLLDHWGLALSSPQEGATFEFAMFEGQRLVALSAGRWTATTPNCQVSNIGIVAQCQIGHGFAFLVGDADMLDSRLWEEAGNDNFPPLMMMLKRPIKKDSRPATRTQQRNEMQN